LSLKLQALNDFSDLFAKAIAELIVSILYQDAGCLHFNPC